MSLSFAVGVNPINLDDLALTSSILDVKIKWRCLAMLIWRKMRRENTISRRRSRGIFRASAQRMLSQ